ncbi:hypothetical protein R1flu_023527 [Riccia fluitans]|uniref:Uncharacterized protein n=1 Tax=Riccia fluitans TaxID=41844 RepID=A0ABD1XSA0_9MARC
MWTLNPKRPPKRSKRDPNNHLGSVQDLSPYRDDGQSKIGMTANRLEMDPPLSTPIGQTSNRGNNHILAGDITKEVHNTSNKLTLDGILEQSVNQMTTMLSNIVEHHGRANHRASLEKDLAHAKLEEEKLKATIQALEKKKRDECQSGIDGEEETSMICWKPRWKAFR